MLRVANWIFACLIVSASAWASDFHSARTDGLGGAGHAGPILNDSIELNPSFASFLPSYSFAYNYNWFSGGATNPDGSSFFHGHGMGASLQDGRSELFQGGVEAAENDNAQMIHLGASKAIIKQLGVGIGAKMIFPTNGQPVTKDATFSLSGVINPTFQAVLVIDNLAEPNPGSLGMYREFIVGTKVNLLGILFVYFDPHFTPDAPYQWGHETGLELTVMKDLYLRGGFFLNSQIPFEGARGNGYAFGAGWFSPRISFDGAVTTAQTPINATNFNTGITLYF